MSTDEEVSSPKNKPDVVRTLNTWSLAGELGIVIAAPLLILILLGVQVDKKLGTTPLFIIVGLLTAMVVSTLGVACKIRQL